MNKLLRSMTTRIQAVNEDRFQATRDHLDVTLKIDAETWRYFEKLDEDSRQMMARVLKDYVERQK